VAYVFDPLAGTEGFFQSRDGKLVLCRRHWVGGRERKSIPKEAAEAEAPDTGASRRGSTDLAAVTTALQKTAVALQAMAARPTESVPLFVWIAGGVLATAVGWSLLTGRPLISAQGDADSRRAGAMLILQRGSQGGPSVGVELREAWTHQGPVVRDEAGRLYVAAELRGPDGNPISLQGLLSQTASAAAPPPAPDVVDHPAEDGGKGRSLRLALAIAAAAIAAAGAAAWLWLRGKHVRRS
jgi:hypothetical protein